MTRGPCLTSVLMLSTLAFAACATPVADTTVDAGADTEIWLVRHAEKQAGDDPALTGAGEVRADALAARLSAAGLTHIHSTDTRRTRDTAAPTAARTGLSVALYEARDLSAFADTLMAQPGTHLVVGHSNTTPQLAEALGCGPQEPIVEATEYDRLYRVRLTDPVRCEIARFGR